MKNTLKKLLGSVLALTIVAAPLAAIAAPYQWKVLMRDSSDLYDVYVPAPLRATSTQAVLGVNPNWTETPIFYYFNECFNLKPAYEEGIDPEQGYEIDLWLHCFPDFLALLHEFDLMELRKVSTSTLQYEVDWLQYQLDTFTTHPQADWTQASTTAKDFIKNKPTLFSGSYNDLSDKPTFFSPTAQPKITDASTTASTSAATNGATNAATNLTADSVAILGINVPTNASYTSLVAAHNDLAAKYNALAVKYNDAATKYNDAATKYNDAATKMNSIIAALEANGILTP